MLNVEFYTKQNCALCEEAYTLLKLLQNDYPFQIDERDIYTNDVWLEEYQLIIPVVRINDTVLTCEEMKLDQLETALQREIAKMNK